MRLKGRKGNGHLWRPRRGVEVQLYSFFELRARWGWVVNATPRPLYPGKDTRYPLYRRLGGPQGRYGPVQKISPLPGFDPRTIQPVADRYTDCANPAHTKRLKYIISAWISKCNFTYPLHGYEYLLTVFFKQQTKDKIWICDTETRDSSENS